MVKSLLTWCRVAVDPNWRTLQIQNLVDTISCNIEFFHIFTHWVEV